MKSFSAAGQDRPCDKAYRRALLRSSGIVLISIMSAGASFIPRPARAQGAATQAVYDFDLPARALADSLRAVGSKAGVNVAFAPSAVRDKQAPALRGSFSPQEAVTRLLEGSGLTVSNTESGSFLISSADPQPAQVAGTSDPNENGSADRHPTGLDDIVVTAQRREERLQDVPVAITAYTPADIESRQITDITAMAQITPNVITLTAYSPADIRVSIRGLSNIQPSLGVDPAVGTYIDGVYYAINTGSNLGFVDMERVEVLKGPQGTLFGRNTIGGLLNITTQRPTNELEGSVQAELGNYDERTVTGILNVPIVSDKLATRLVYQHAEHSGYGEDTYLNQPHGDMNENYVRLGVRADPNDDWNILVTGSWSRMTGHSPSQKFSYIDPNSYLNAYYPGLSSSVATQLGGGFYDTRAGINPPLLNSIAGITGTITGKVGGVTLKSITGYNRVHEDLGTDYDGTPVPFLDMGAQRIRVNQLSQEVQLLGNAFDDRLQWISGLYYFNDKGYEDQFLRILYGASASGNSQHVDNSSYGGFTQGTYAVLPDLRFTAGVRYTSDTRKTTWHDRSVSLADYSTFVQCNLALPVGTSVTDQAACGFSSNAKFHYVPWTVGLDYKPNEDTLLYAKVSKGYRSGGSSYSGPPAAATAAGVAASQAAYGQAFLPENALQPEIGVKWEGLDHTVRINMAAFYTDYKAVQLNIILPSPTVGGTPLNVTRNVGEASIYGVEGDAMVLIQGARLNLSAGWVDPKYTRGPEVGYPFVNTAKFSWALGVGYPIENQYGVLSLSADYSWRSTMYGYEPIYGNPIQIDGARQKSFGLLSAKTTFELANVPVTLSLWGKNLLGKHYKADPVDYFGYGLDSSGYIAGDPRTFGVGVKYAFQP